jgi:lipopolysaccharide heptosyltransferase I
MKIALVRLSSLGDIILGMASLQIIRRALPDCRITWAADRRFADILDCSPDIHQVVRLDLKALKKQFSLAALGEEYRQLRSPGPFDLVIDLHGMIKSAVTARLMGGPCRGFDRNSLKEPLATLLYRQSYPVPLEQPAACRYASLVCQSLGLPQPDAAVTEIRPFLFSRERDLAVSAEFFSNQRRNILFVPETSAANKNYLPERFARLAAVLGENIMVCHGNQQELRTAQAIAAQSANVRVLPRLDLNQLKAAVGRADLVIGGDSGPTHIAWGCGVPSITLFGATPVCFQPTAINRVIKTSSVVNYRKPDPADLSIRRIEVEEIAVLAAGLLERGR